MTWFIIVHLWIFMNWKGNRGLPIDSAWKRGSACVHFSCSKFGLLFWWWWKMMHFSLLFWGVNLLIVNKSIIQEDDGLWIEICWPCWHPFIEMWHKRYVCTCCLRKPPQLFRESFSTCLIYWGDSLQWVHTLKDAKYFDNKAVDCLVDQTLGLNWNRWKLKWCFKWFGWLGKNIRDNQWTYCEVAWGN